ncbi:hypothetical protein CRD60_03985 [Bifidobacterium aemilianum]|uniref:Cobalt ABC transporter permease n=1 Tax=Bifidobacterium aemilianum TaxID=2493120 RepID=A0A366KAS7_9BIFI|nr:energy-coupling factor transporter transmembrane component T [Bifidobacterium aemilianum]RBP97771.1 hypothetical protein CRD60_03985 [Bifidobacterium aemilianum]
MRPLCIYTKFALVVFSNALLFVTLPDWLNIIICCYLCALLALSGKVRSCLKWLLVCAVFALGNALAFLYPDNIAGHYLLFVFAGFGKLLPVVLVGALIMTTTKTSELMVGLRGLHLPRWIIIPTSVLFRFFPTIIHDYRQIRAAMRFRGIAVTAADMLLHPLRTMEYIYIPLLNNASTVANDLTSAALTRGITNPKPKTSLYQVTFSWVDAVVLALGCLLTGVAFHA